MKLTTLFTATILGGTVIGIVAAGCDSESAPASTPGLRATEKFMETWNTRDPEVWASSLNYPHARPSVGAHRIWLTRDEYVAGVDLLGSVQ